MPLFVVNHIKKFINAIVTGKNLTLCLIALCVIQCDGETEVEWQHFGSTAPATAGYTDRILQIKDRTSVFDPGTGRSFLATLCLFIFKIIKIACLCSFLSLLFIILCPLLPLIIPAVLFSTLFAISLIALLTVVPPPQQPPVGPTVPPIPPPFTSIPARK